MVVQMGYFDLRTACSMHGLPQKVQGRDRHVIHMRRDLLCICGKAMISGAVCPAGHDPVAFRIPPLGSGLTGLVRDGIQCSLCTKFVGSGYGCRTCRHIVCQVCVMLAGPSSSEVLQCLLEDEWNYSSTGTLALPKCCEAGHEVEDDFVEMRVCLNSGAG